MGSRGKTTDEPSWVYFVVNDSFDRVKIGVGGAQMAELHSNFLINRGGASASDCLLLSAEVKQAVLATSGVQLEEEVRIVGEEP